jgi:acyl-CoA synthetase (AMP-forming)/AMP-acid ligase II
LIIGRGFEDFTLPEKADSSATIKLIYENKAARFESLKSIANNGQSDWDFQAIIDSDAAALNIFTSGTTGPSKTAVHTQGGLFLTTVTMLTDETLFDSSTVYLNYAPLFHFGGMNAMLQTLGIGGTLVLTEDFRPESMLGIIEREKVSNLMVLPPSLCLRFYEECSKREYDLASVKVIILAGGVCTQEIAEYTFSLFRNACMFNGYSQSENAVRMALKLTREEYKNEPNLINSVGVPSAWCEVRLVDENGVDVDRGECGEVWGRSPYMLDHYLEGDAFVDGWFQTGDLMRQDTNGRFYFMGRVKDMIKSGGENVYACEVEETIMKSGLIQEVAVVGLPDKYLNEIVVAVAVLTPNAVFSENDVIEWCKENMASYKKPRRVYFVDALPLEVTGMLSKTKLRTLLLESM